jgi:L-fuculose-phosphate aldolase
MDKKSLADAKAELIKLAQRGYRRGLTAGTGGNISLKIPGTDSILINASGTSWSDACDSSLLAVDLDGRVVDGEGIPSKETKWHCGLYRLRPEIGSVVHSHSPAATAFAVVGKDLDLVSATAYKALKHVPALGYAPPGSDELSKIVLDGFSADPEIKAILLQNHGVVTVGVDVYQAIYFAEVVEDKAKMALYSRMLGEPLSFT